MAFGISERFRQPWNKSSCYTDENEDDEQLDGRKKNE